MERSQDRRRGWGVASMLGGSIKRSDAIPSIASGSKGTPLGCGTGSHDREGVPSKAGLVRTMHLAKFEIDDP